MKPSLRSKNIRSGRTGAPRGWQRRRSSIVAGAIGDRKSFSQEALLGKVVRRDEVAWVLGVVWGLRS